MAAGDRTTAGDILETVTLPFCGSPPLPAELWTRWTLDPALLAALALLPLAFHGILARRSPPLDRSQIAFFWAGWASLVIAFVSPLCALSAALFSARVAHHVILVSVAAPLLALTLPRGLDARRPGLWLLAHAFALWFWHAPVPYGAALASDALYWTMQASLFVTALLFWRSVLSMPGRLVAGPLLLLGAMMQMGLLGALITFAPRPLYAAHFLSPEPFGLTALADQQLAGLIMWAPGALPYLAAALVLAARGIAGGERTVGAG